MTVGSAPGLEQNRFGDVYNGNYIQIDPDTGKIHLYGSATLVFETGANADDIDNFVKGELGWDDKAQTLAFKQNGSTLQLGQEFHFQVL